MMKHFRDDWKDGIVLVCSVILFFLALLLPAACALSCEWSQEEKQLLSAYEHGEIIRLHVIANSDSPRDQEIKYAVRDALIEAFGTLLESSASSSNEAFSALEENAESMEQLALETARSMGFTGEVQSQTGRLELPEKRYGNVLLPAGRYRALRIVIGKGEGQNWWCVLYPQLCLALSEEEDQKSLTWDSVRIFSNWLVFHN